MLDIHRGGVKLEFMGNSFDSIRNFAIRLIEKSKKYSRNLMKINSNSIQSIQLQLKDFQKLDSFKTFRLYSKIYNLIDSQGEKIFEKFDKNQF